MKRIVSAILIILLLVNLSACVGIGGFGNNHNWNSSSGGNGGYTSGGSSITPQTKTISEEDIIAAFQNAGYEYAGSDDMPTDNGYTLVWHYFMNYSVEEEVAFYSQECADSDEAEYIFSVRKGKMYQNYGDNSEYHVSEKKGANYAMVIRDSKEGDVSVYGETFIVLQTGNMIFEVSADWDSYQDAGRKYDHMPQKILEGIFS